MLHHWVLINNEYFYLGFVAYYIHIDQIRLILNWPWSWRLHGLYKWAAWSGAVLSCLHGTPRQLAVNSTANTHTRAFNCPFPGIPRWAGTRKIKPIWVLLKQETVSGSGIRWAICKSAHRSRQITMPAPHHSVFLQAKCPSWRPTNSIKALTANRSAPQNHTVIAGAWFYCPHALADCNWHTWTGQKLLRVFVSSAIYTPIPCNTRTYRNIHLGLVNDN